MGASRKLQGEIDRVLKKVQEGVDVFDSIWNKVYDTDNANQKEKFEADLKKEIKKLQRYRDQIKTWIQSSEIKDKKVSASYEQALMDARKQIEREMERFKICEKETKTKAFSKEGLGQQPKTDPKEKAKSEARDWLNNVVGELESQIDNFEAEIEGLSVRKGKTRPPRLTHLEASISRHKAHIMKLELILRLLDNDELSPEQVNDVKDFLDDYVERNQEDFDEFSDVDELYSSLPLDKVESLEDLVIIGPALVKGVGTTTPALGIKTSSALSPTQQPVTVTPFQQGAPIQEQVEETASQDNNSDTIARTPQPKNSTIVSSAPSTPAENHATPVAVNASTHNLSVAPTASTILSGSSSVRVALENAGSALSSSPLNISNSSKEEDTTSFPGRKSSPALAETGLRGIGRGGLTSQPSTTIPLPSGIANPSNGGLSAASSASEMIKRNIAGPDERLGGSGVVQPLVSPLSNRMILPQAAKANDGTGPADGGNIGEGGVMSGRVFSPSAVPGMQWMPGSPFQNQSEVGQFRGRTEIAPDQREKFLQRLQQVQQQGPSNILGMAPLGGGQNPKQFSAQQQNPLLQQFNSQSLSVSPQAGLGLGVQASGLTTSASTSQQQPTAIHQQSAQQALISTGTKEAGEVGHAKIEDMQQQQNLSDDSTTEPASSTGFGKNLINDDDLKASIAPDAPAGVSGSSTEPAQVPRDIDLSPGQPLQSNQPSGSLGVIGRRSVSDLGTIGDNLGGSSANSGGMRDQSYSMQMLEAAYYKLPHPKDSERAKSYIPRHPAVTPPSYPQGQAPIVNNPAFWERLGADNYGTDTLFFAFYYQQNTYQQYLAAKELKKQSWRYHRKYSTWFQRHEEPKVTTDEYEQGSYIYFDFHTSDEMQRGWCQRIKPDFMFEYNYLEDELIV
ncbi:general negative regulator of transcription subunit 3-like isoform X1 [Actinidia eriantha]|uniref:general negative regulator of transcription subunit 3-like isoform X1 n=1 Tax=Actinidia eriantha TaxID=165200 RepID=UPI0025912034|nr:general negative regulator of transcription subunit 3-like isoform X1 [Actinidia eriantha]